MGATAAEANGRPQDTESLYREHGGAVAKLCRSLLRDRTEAEDATQQVFLSAHRALLNGAAPREPLAWLLAVARNECYARFRQRAAAPVPAAEAPEGASADASVHVLRARELANVWDEVGRMPSIQREAFLLREIRGLSYGQLADELSLSPPSVRSLLLRARTRLRRRLGDVAAGLGGAPWVQALMRLLAGDGASPLPTATKAAAVGFGALALAGGGGLVARHALQTPGHAGTRHPAHARVGRAAAPATATPVASAGAHQRIDGRGSELERSAGRDGAGSSGSDGSGSSGESQTLDTSSGDRTSGGGSDGSDGTTAVAQPTDGHDGARTPSSSESSGSGDGVTSGSGSDSSSTSTTTTTTTTTTSTTTATTTTGSDGSGGGGTDGSLTDGHGG